MPGPIKPSEVSDKKQATIPEVVFDAFNTMIVKNWSDSSGSATVKQKDVAAIIKRALPDIDIYAMGYMDVEPVYRKAGWRVEYDKPGYNESYEAFFVFSKRQ